MNGAKPDGVDAVARQVASVLSVDETYVKERLDEVSQDEDLSKFIL